MTAPTQPSSSPSSGVNWNVTLALTVVLFILGSLAYWLEFSRKPKTEEAAEKTKKPFDLKETQIASLKVSDGSQSFTFQCLDTAQGFCKPGDNSKWELTFPMKVRADDSNVNSLVSAINNLSATEVIDLSEESAQKREALLREYRLDDSSRKASTTPAVEVQLTGKPAQSVYLGELHPMGSTQFALSGEAGCMEEKAPNCRVFMIPTSFQPGLAHDLTYWRDKKLLGITPAEVLSFELQGSKGVIQAERRDGSWILRSPANQELPGDIENIDQLITSVAYLSAKDFVSDNKTDAKAKKALQGASKVLTLKLKGKKESTLTLHRKKDQLHALISDSDPLYEVDPGTFEKLNKEIKDLRLTKLLTTMDRFSAREISYQAPGMTAPLVITQKENKWVKADGSEVDNGQIQMLLDRLSGNRIKDFITSGPDARGPDGKTESLTLSIGTGKAGGTDSRRSFIFWKKGNQLFARTLQDSGDSATQSRSKEVLKVDSAIQDALPWGQDFFKKPGEAKPPAQPPGKPGDGKGTDHGLDGRNHPEHSEHDGHSH